jgi:general secretion pathway protein G
MDTLVTALPPGAAACAARRAPAPAARGGGPGPRGARGFTLIELVVTLTLVSVLAMVAVPLYEVTVTRNKESELRGALRDIRTALDAYKTAADTGIISKGLADSGYPPTLKTLVEGVDTIATPVNGGNAGVNSAATSSNGSPGFGAPGGGTGGGFASTQGAGSGAGSPGTSIDAIPSHMVFLRQIPRDPFFEDQTVAPDQQWNIRAYGALPGDYSGGADVYDVSTKSTGIGLNGIAYKDW